MTRRELKALVRRVVREEIKRYRSDLPKPRRRPCGVGSSPPECMGSVNYGPKGCYCR